LVVCTGEEVAIAVPAAKTIAKPLSLLESFRVSGFRAAELLHTGGVVLPVL